MKKKKLYGKMKRIFLVVWLGKVLYAIDLCNLSGSLFHLTFFTELMIFLALSFFLGKWKIGK